MGKLISLWKEEECPDLNGVMYPDDTIKPIDPFEIPEAGIVQFAFGKGIPIGSVDPGYTSIVVPSCESTYENLDLRLVGGEASHGEEGFMAATNLAGELLWLVFFTFSNPIVRVEVVGENVVGTNNYYRGVKWLIPLKDQSTIKVVADKTATYPPPRQNL